MKKNIDTLVEDIYSLFDLDKKNNLKDLDKHLKEFTDGVTETIKHLINDEHTPKRNLRLSAIGKPARQLWYDKHTEHEDKKLNPSLRIKFFYGHLLEEVLILFTKLAVVALVKSISADVYSFTDTLSIEPMKVPL